MPLQNTVAVPYYVTNHDCGIGVGIDPRRGSLAVSTWANVGAEIEAIYRNCVTGITHDGGKAIIGSPRILSVVMTYYYPRDTNMTNELKNSFEADATGSTLTDEALGGKVAETAVD